MGLPNGAEAPISALTGFEAAVRLVDDVDPTLTPHQAVVAVPATQGFQGISDFHVYLELLFGGYIRSPPQTVNAIGPTRG